MKKLIETVFVYSMLDRYQDREHRGYYQGTYGGRKPASRRTLQAFVNANGANFKPLIVSIGGSYRSAYIAK